MKKKILTSIVSVALVLAMFSAFTLGSFAALYTDSYSRSGTLYYLNDHSGMTIGELLGNYSFSITKTAARRMSITMAVYPPSSMISGRVQFLLEKELSNGTKETLDFHEGTLQSIETVDYTRVFVMSTDQDTSYNFTAVLYLEDNTHHDGACYIFNGTLYYDTTDNIEIKNVTYQNSFYTLTDPNPNPNPNQNS